MCKFCTHCLGIYLALGKGIANMAANDRSVFVEQLRHLRLRQPNCLFFHLHRQSDLAVRRLEKHYLVIHRRCLLFAIAIVCMFTIMQAD